MPAILRKSLPKLLPSMSYIRPYAQNDVVGVGRAGSATVSQGSNGMPVCNTMPCVRCVYYFFLNVFLRYWAYASRPTITTRNTMLVIIVCVFNTAAGKAW